MRSFVGRRAQLQAFDNRLDLREGGLLRFTGQAGIGKSRLLREFRRHCEEQGRPFVWLNLENAAEIPDGNAILFELGRSATGFPEARRAALQQNGNAGEALNRYDKTFDKLADSAKLIDPSGGVLTEAIGPESAIVAFQRWLIRNDDPAVILQAIDVLEAGVRFTWGFSELADTIAALPPARRTIARACIDFFEDRIDRTTLAGC